MKLMEPGAFRVDAIEEAEGMRRRVVDDGKGGWTLVDNARYRGRPAERIARVFASAS